MQLPEHVIEHNAQPAGQTVIHVPDRPGLPDIGDPEAKKCDDNPDGLMPDERQGREHADDLVQNNTLKIVDLLIGRALSPHIQTPPRNNTAVNPRCTGKVISGSNQNPIAVNSEAQVPGANGQQAGAESERQKVHGIRQYRPDKIRRFSRVFPFIQRNPFASAPEIRNAETMSAGTRYSPYWTAPANTRFRARCTDSRHGAIEIPGQVTMIPASCSDGAVKQSS